MKWTERLGYQNLGRKLHKLHPDEPPVRFAARLEKLQAITRLKDQIDNFQKDIER